MVVEIVLNYLIWEKLLMLFTLKAYWMRSTRRLRFLDLRAPIKWRESPQKFLNLRTQLVVLQLSFSIITTIFLFHFQSFFDTNSKFCLISVVRQTSLQGHVVGASWIVQQKFWNIHHWREQPNDRGDSCCWTNHWWCLIRRTTPLLSTNFLLVFHSLVTWIWRKKIFE